MMTKSTGSAATSGAKATKDSSGGTSADTSGVALSDRPGTADTAGLSEDKLKAAAGTDMEGSGAFVEPTIKERIDVDHPAVDNTPRAGQPADANRIDFNEPSKPSDQAVADNLKAQQG